MRTEPILLVEDDDDDAELTILAFREASIGNPIVRVRDGVEALDYLLCRGKYQGPHQGARPAVVLLDLKLPRLSGLEVLQQIRESPSIKHLPVVILTTSDDEQDRIQAYERHANSYVRKQVDYDQFVNVSRQLGLYWTVTNLPPPSTS